MDVRNFRCRDAAFISDRGSRSADREASIILTLHKMFTYVLECRRNNSFSITSVFETANNFCLSFLFLYKADRARVFFSKMSPNHVRDVVVFAGQIYGPYKIILIWNSHSTPHALLATLPSCRDPHLEPIRHHLLPPTVNDDVSFH